MEPRRPSIISDVSMRQRKYSTDRVLRQAELSARLEEGRPLVGLASPSQIVEHPDEQRLDTRGAQTLTRADTLVSPFEFHPGQRVDSFPWAGLPGVNENFELGPIKAWDEPTVAQQEDIERRAAAPVRVETTSLDFSPAQAQLYRTITRSVSHTSSWKWPFWTPNQVKAAKPSAINGLQIAAAMHTALGLKLMAHKSPDWLRRQQLHILEYKTSDSRAFSCHANCSFNETGALRQHLYQVRSGLPKPGHENTVRLIHIRNNTEAFRFVDEAFAISSAEIHYGERGFRDWMQEDRDFRRSSNVTIRWRPGFDTNRGVICTAIGIDLGYSGLDLEELNARTDKKSKPEQSLFRRRRIAIYMQRSPSAATPNARVTQFNSRGKTFYDFAKQDNIVVCEYSSDAWGEISSTPSLLALSPVGGMHKTGSAAVMASVIAHIFWEIVSKWESQIAAIHQPFADLEELVHEQPSDMTHSNQVWEWSRNLQVMYRLVGRHLKAIQTFQDDFELFAELEEDEWLDDALLQLKHIADTIRGDYIEPLEHMIDLMYKSVTIRDSRLSLELGTSLWRLSWITFIFLPLTFLVGFFGMNVDLFRDDPSIKWYFVALVPLALLITAFWALFNQYGLEYKTYDVRPKARKD